MYAVVHKKTNEIAKISIKDEKQINFQE